MSLPRRCVQDRGGRRAGRTHGEGSGGAFAPGQAKVIRAAFEAGVKPATIARQFRLSRAQVEQIIGKPTRSKR